jgi:hypothetical protein
VEACGGGRVGRLMQVAPPAIVVRVAGPATSRSTASCFLLLRARIVGGGTQIYCLRRFAGAPGPRATVRDGGVMTFALRAGTIRAAVRVVERFGADGRHARMQLAGTVVGGTGGYRGARGTVLGGGRVVERSAGHIASSSLRYVLTLR